MNKDMAMDADMQNKMDQARKDMPASLAKMWACQTKREFTWFFSSHGFSFQELQP